MHQATSNPCRVSSYNLDIVLSVCMSILEVQTVKILGIPFVGSFVESHELYGTEGTFQWRKCMVISLEPIRWTAVWIRIQTLFCMDPLDLILGTSFLVCMYSMVILICTAIFIFWQSVCAHSKHRPVTWIVSHSMWCYSANQVIFSKQRSKLDLFFF